MGTPDFAVESLRVLLKNKYNIVAVVTQPDKAVGRHSSILQPTPVKQFALEQGLKVLTPTKLKNQDFIEELRSLKADLQIVVAFRMLPKEIWDMPQFGTFNIHASLLPQYRGAAPINWAIINGEKETGVTSFFLDENIDTGKIILKRSCKIRQDYYLDTVYRKLMKMGADLCLDTVKLFFRGWKVIPTVPQNKLLFERDDLKAAPKIFKETCEVNWQQPAKRVYDFVRGLSPYPGAWTTLVAPDGKATVLKIFKTTKTDRPSGGVGQVVAEKKHFYIGTADTLLQIDELQLAGKKRMDAQAFLNGMKDLENYSVH